MRPRRVQLQGAVLLRRQSPNFDKLSFLSGHSAMAKRIRDFDWSTHPLGPPDTWSAALRSALGIALNSAFPTCIYWGPELRLLYNDSWSLIPGPRHPGCLGEPAEEVWSDIWHVIEPQFTRAISRGEGVYFRDQMLPMRRYGVEEETYWTYNFTPIRDDDGSIRGVFNSGNETTRQVMQQTHTRFLLELSDVYRTMGDVDAVRGRSLEMLGRHLEVDRVGLREQRHSDPDHALPVVEQWCAEGVEPVPAARGQVPIDNSAWAELLLGRVVRIDGSTPGREEVERKVLDQIGCASALAVPWVTEGRTEAILFAHSFAARHWTDLEVETVEAVLSRMMTLMERTRAIARERLMSREINHRARNLLSVAQAMIRLARAEEPETMRAKLIDRLSALAKNHALLANQRWEPVALRQILEQELAPYRGNSAIRIGLEGPHVVLTPDECQSLGMVFHELTSNAAKFGALRQTGGGLEVSWGLTPEDRLAIDWREACDTPPPAPETAKDGFGTNLLHLMVERQHEGRLTRELTSEGMHCAMDLPWRAATPATEPA